MINLSILLRTRTVFTLASQAYRMTVRVYGLTPSTTSIITIAPSERLTAELTSMEKSTCPGESIKFIKCYFSSAGTPFRGGSLWACRIDMDDAFIVIWRSCSSSRESRYRRVPANFCEMMLFEEISVSDIVVLPWST